MNEDDLATTRAAIGRTLQGLGEIVRMILPPEITTPRDAVLRLWCPWDDLPDLVPGATCWVCDRVITVALDGPYNLLCPRCNEPVELSEPCPRCGQAISPTDVWAQARAATVGERLT